MTAAPGPRARGSVTVRRLVSRQWRSDPGTAVLLAVVVLVVSAVLTVWPRAVDTLLGADLAQSVSRLTAAQRDVSGSSRWGVIESPQRPEQVLPEEAARLQDLARTEAGPTLGRALGEPEVVLTRVRTPVDKGPDADDVVAMSLAMRVDQHLADRVRLVEGTLPGPFDDDGDERDLALAAQAVADGPVLDVALSASTAERMRWPVGQERALLDPLLPLTVRLSGTFEAVDPDADVWSHLESTLFPFVVEDGDVGTTVHGIGYVDPTALTVLPHPQGLTATAWYPVGDLAEVDRTDLTAELRGFLAATGWTSELAGTLEAADARHQTLTTLLGVLLSGPTGVGLAVLWLVAVLAVRRRRTALRLAWARGATRAHLALVVALESAVVCVPAAAVGAVVAIRLVPGELRPRDLVVPALVALAPAGLAALATVVGGFGAVGGGRRRPGRRRRWRLLAEVAVVVLAAYALLSVRTRGLGGGATGTDPFLVAAPLLVTGAVCVLVLRLYPLLAVAATRALHRRTHLPHFLGAARTSRAPAGGVVPLLALVLAVAVALLSATVLSTVRGGIDRTAARAVGADLRLDAVSFTQADRDAVASTDGVVAVAAVGRAGRVVLDVAGGADEQLDLVTVDADALAQVQGALPGVDALPALTAVDGSVPALFASGDRLPLHRGLSFEDAPTVTVEPVGEVTGLPGVASGRTWFVADRRTVVETTGAADVVHRLLVRLAPGADVDRVRAAVLAALGPATVDGVTTTSRAQAEQDLRSGVLVRGLEAGLVAVTALTALLVALLVVLTLAVAAPERSRLLSLLSVLGAARASGRTLVLWEVGPLVLVAAAAGAAAGTVLPRVLLPVSDLRLFTGGDGQPPVATDPVLLAVLAAVVVLTAVLAGVPAARTRRAPAVVLREGERP